MKSKLSKPLEQTDDVAAYPCLKLCQITGEKLIVMFSSNKTGICVYSNRNRFGENRDRGWAEEAFTLLPPDISVSLSNCSIH